MSTRAEDLARQQWDVVIVGAGMGGATLGHALAKAGKRVLFCEKGINHLGMPDVIRGRFAESTFPKSEVPSGKHRDLLATSGRWTDSVVDMSTARVRRFVPHLGSGSGGSSSLYGAALERFLPSDFGPQASLAGADGNEPGPPWPITYEELRPFYRSAEELYGVRGGLDPLRPGQLDPLLPPGPMSEASCELHSFLLQKGCHPYRLPTASKLTNDCKGCQGYLCARACKRHAGNACLAPALDKHGAEILDRCRVVRLLATGGRVTGVLCSVDGEEVVIRGRTIVLAAGALESPCILLRSRCSEWPTGLANRSGLVGRYLMRHYIDLYAVAVRAVEGRGSSIKQLAVNDLYQAEGMRGVTLHSFGALPPAQVLVAELEQGLVDRGAGWARPALAMARPVLEGMLQRRLSRSVILASIMQDHPRLENHVRPHGNGVDNVVEYRICANDKLRIREGRQRVGGMLRPYRYMLLKQAENNARIAHACGTCRAGEDPARSVLDRDNLAHDLDNLYVVDSSFFPSSGGVNPALTIAANALRVAERLLSIA